MRDLVWHTCFHCICIPDRSPPDTAYAGSRTSSRWKTPGFMPTSRCPGRTNGGSASVNRTFATIRSGYLYLPAGDGPETPPAQAEGSLHPLSSARSGVQSVPVQSALHPEQSGATVQAQSGRGIPGPSPWLPCDGGVQEGDAQTRGLGRAALREAKNWHGFTSIPAAGIAESER